MIKLLSNFLYRYRILIAILSWLFTIAITIVIISNPRLLQGMSSLGFFGLFVANIANGACLIFGGPSQVLTFMFASNFSPLLSGIIAGVGTSIGELTGYFIGRYSFHSFTDEWKIKIDKIKLKYLRVFLQYPKLFLFLIALIPNPIFDIISIIAGFSNIKFLNYFIPVILGKVLRFLIISYLGYNLMPRTI